MILGKCHLLWISKSNKNLKKKVLNTYDTDTIPNREGSDFILLRINIKQKQKSILNIVGGKFF